MNCSTVAFVLHVVFALTHGKARVLATLFANHTIDVQDELIGRVLKPWHSNQNLDFTTMGKATNAQYRFSRRRTAPYKKPAGCTETFVLKERCKKREREKQEKTPKHLIPRIDIVYQSWGKEGFYDKYRIEEELGHGSFGTVYKAISLSTGRYRAVKKIDKSRIMQLELTRDEIHALLHIDHPQIIKFMRYYEEPTHLYLLFELCTGPSLHDRIMEAVSSSEGRMSEFDVAVALRHMLKALKCCHGKFMGHYDIKPENFMYLNPERTNLKLIDFGLSSGFDRQADTIKGSYEYAAPETFQRIYGPETDVWSCGIVLFRMLTGKSFFSQESLPITEPDVIEQLLKDSQYVYDRVKWASKQGSKKGKYISDEAHSLLKQMLLPDRHMRISVTAALQHPFIVNSYNHDLFTSEQRDKAFVVLEGVTEDFRKFVAQPMLTRATLQLTAHLAAHNQGEIEQQRLAFAMLDNLRHGTYGRTAGTTMEMNRRESIGELSEESFRQALRFYNISIPKDMSYLFQFIDTDGDGYISFTDFLSATLPKAVFINHINFWAAFSFFDRDGNGFINAHDLMVALGCKTAKDKENCREAMREVCPAPHRLSFEQFLHVVRNGTMESLARSKSGVQSMHPGHLMRKSLQSVMGRISPTPTKRASLESMPSPSKS